MLRWQKGDYVRLGKAVAEFNRQISKNQTEANKQYLPETIDYKTLRDRIQTREGLNAYIQSMKRIKLEGSTDLIKLENGQIITKYQKGELERGRAQAIKSLEKEARELELKKKISLGATDIDELPEAFKSAKQKEVELKISEYKNLYKLTKEDFKKRAFELGINQTELKYRRAYVFRRTYLQNMRENYSNFTDYWIFKKYFVDKNKNPINFYNALPEDSEFFPSDIQYQSDNLMGEDDFRRFLEILGIDVQAIYEKEGKRRGLSGSAYEAQKRAEAKEKQEKAQVKKQ